MTPEERQLISGLFDRMRGFSLPQKDAEAEALINEQVMSLRDAPYMLVQSVLVQEHALQQADARIRELEERVRTLESEASQERSAGSGSFLGGLFGGGRASPAAAEGARSSSVPTVGARATSSVYDRPGSSAWSRQPPTQAGGPFAQAQPSGGGFLQSAMATAAGVAGGMLVAGAISNMLGGNSAGASTPSAAAQPAADTAKAEEATQAKDDAYQDGQQDAVQDASYDSGDDGWFGGDGGGDFDI